MKSLIYTAAMIHVLFGQFAWAEQAANVNTIGSYSIEALKVVMSLVLVLFIFYVGVTVFKKYLGGAYKGNSSIRVIGGLSIGHKEKLVLVAAGDVNLLLGVSSAGVNKLHCFSKQEFPESEQSENSEVKSFSQHLNKLTSKI